ncbi:MAG: uracil-DNA glycosylase family protein [Acidobacteriota bacterium]
MNIDVPSSQSDSTEVASRLEEICRDLSRRLEPLTFAEPVTHVYNPLIYAWEPWSLYLRRFAGSPEHGVLLGMNPGPWGMSQTGVPFGEIAAARDWLGLEASVGKPDREHPKRPVTGFDCTRSEVSGRRLWGWAQERFGTPEAFFQRFFVWNYCPLVFLEESGRNRTPDRLPAGERQPLFEACDEALREAVKALGVSRVVGVGRFAETRARRVLGDFPVEIRSILHPSPASPKANAGWAPVVEEQLQAMGIPLPASLPPEGRS